MPAAERVAAAWEWGFAALSVQVPEGMATAPEAGAASPAALASASAEPAAVE